jgi:hypothetical protein
VGGPGRWCLRNIIGAQPAKSDQPSQRDTEEAHANAQDSKAERGVGKTVLRAVVDAEGKDCTARCDGKSEAKDSKGNAGAGYETNPEFSTYARRSY